MLIHYLVIAFRNLAKRSVFSIINIGGLAMTLASCVFVFYYVYDELTYDRSHGKADRIYRITQTFITPESTQNIRWTHQKLGPYLRRVYPQVENYVRMEDAAVSLGKSKLTEKGIVRADPSVFDVFTYPLLSGNPATALTHPNSIVLSESLAKKFFINEALGETLDVDGVPHVVTGVMKDVPSNSDKWISALLYAGFEGEESEGLYYTFDSYLLLKSESDAGFVGHELANVASTFHHSSGQELKAGLEMQPLTGLHFHHGTEMDNPKGNKTTVMIFGAVALILIVVAIFNFINLTTVRSLERAREIGVRKVAGAQRGQLISQFLGESFLSLAAASVLALLVMQSLKAIFEKISGKIINFTNAHDLYVLGGILTLLAMLTLCSAIYPALILSGFKPIHVLKMRLTRSGRGIGLRKVFIAGQFAVSAGLLVFLVALLMQTKFMRTTDPGFEKDQILVLRAPEDTAVSRNLNFYKDEFLRNKGVENLSVGGFASNPGTNDAIASPLWLNDGSGRQLIVPNITVDKDYPGMLRFQLTQGISFADIETHSVKGKALVNEAFVNLAGWTDPLGKEISTYSGKGEVIGVVKNFHFKSLHNSIEPIVIMGMDDANPDARFFFIKTAASNLDDLQVLWRRLFPQYPFDYFFLDEFYDEQYRSEENMEALFIYFTLLTIAISASGLFGLTYYHVEMKMKEVGIRKVFGAGRMTLVRFLSADFIKLTGVGALAGMLTGYFVTQRWLLNFAYHVDLSIGVVVLPVIVLVFLAMLVVGYKTFSGATTKPVDILRHE